MSSWPDADAHWFQRREGPTWLLAAGLYGSWLALVLGHEALHLHIVHHRHPTMPWFAIPRFCREHRDALLALNGHYVYSGYGELVRRYALRPAFVPVHPRA